MKLLGQKSASCAKKNASPSSFIETETSIPGSLLQEQAESAYQQFHLAAYVMSSEDRAAALSHVERLEDGAEASVIVAAMRQLLRTQAISNEGDHCNEDDGGDTLAGTTDYLLNVEFKNAQDVLWRAIGSIPLQFLRKCCLTYYFLLLQKLEENWKM